MTGFFLAWATGQAIIFYRWGALKAPPTPGVLAAASGLFVGLAVIGEYQPARPVVTAFAWAVDLAILMQVIGKVPQAATGWPPPAITDQTAVFPTGTASTTAATTAATGTSTSATGTAATA